MKYKGRSLAITILVVSLLICVVQIVQTHFVADMSAFMPNSPNARQQLLVDQLRDGAIARIIMVGIEGGDATERARISHDLAENLRKTQAFVSIQNGSSETQEHDRAYIFDNRYLLSPDVTPERFTVEGLRSSIANSINALSGNSGLILKQLLPHDPTGEALQPWRAFAERLRVIVLRWRNSTRLICPGQSKLGNWCWFQSNRA
jgi:predicted exporter